jgi:acyl dehydratase
MAVPEAYDVGFQRQCWQIQLLTNWIGDAGELRRASAQYRKFVYHGDVVRLGGRVRRVYRDASGAACVDLSTHALNQRGDDVMPGEATVVLPTRH